MMCVELFAGAGGAALGLEAAGIEHAALCEWDPYACATLRAAGLGPVIEGNTADIDYRPFRGVDLLWASPPCQMHSSAGNGSGYDGWPDVLRCIRETAPRWVAIENVIGAPVEQWCADLRDLRFTVRAFLLNAARYGVPQRRRRWFIVAGPFQVVPRAPSMRETPASVILGHGWIRAEGCGATGRSTAEPSFTVTKAGNLYWYPSNPGPRKKGDRVKGGRRVTVNECAALQDFPADYPWQGPQTAQYRQIGNAVPPRLAEVVGHAVMQAERCGYE